MCKICRWVQKKNFIWFHPSVVTGLPYFIPNGVTFVCKFRYGEKSEFIPVSSSLFVNLNAHGEKSEFYEYSKYKLMKYIHKFSQEKLHLETSWVYLKTGHMWKNGWTCRMEITLIVSLTLACLRQNGRIFQCCVITMWIRMLIFGNISPADLCQKNQNPPLM